MSFASISASLLFAGMAVVIFAVSGLSPFAPSRVPGSRGSQSIAETLIVEDQDTPQPIYVRRGERAVVAFEYNGGSGYRWWPVEPLPRGVRMLGNDFTSVGPDNKLGGRSRQTLTLALEGANEAEVEVVFRRSWNAAAPNDKRLLLKVIASD
jgi:predicted secreted protein